MTSTTRLSSARLARVAVLALMAGVGSVLRATDGATQPTSSSGGPLTIDAVAPNVDDGTLTVAGANFGTRPFVTLDLIPLDVRVAIDTRVVAVAPVGAMPPGAYLLTVSRGPGAAESASREVTLHGGAPKANAVTSLAADVPLQSGTDTAATVGDRAISVADVDREWQRNDPASYLALMRQLEASRRRVANQMVADAVLAREAEARGTTTEALLKEELPKRTIAMPDSASTSLYLSMGERTRGASIDQMRPALRAWMQKHTEPELARMNLVEELMKTSTHAEVVVPSIRANIAITARDPALGPASAPITIMAFGDLQSNEYVRLAQVFTRVRDTFGERVRIVFRHLPTFGEPSDAVARAAACAHEQGKFWEYHDAATRPGTLDGTRLRSLAAEMGLDVKAFAACTDSAEMRGFPARAVEDAGRYGISASPSFLVNGRLAPDVPAFLPPFEFLKRLIEEELQRQSRAASGR